MISQRVPAFLSAYNIIPIYCGNHASMYKDQDICRIADNLDPAVKRRKIETRRRIPCPVDPSHTIYETNLKKHLLICPKAKEAREERQKNYYQHNINTGGHGAHSMNLKAKNEESKKNIDPLSFALQILMAYKQIFLPDAMKKGTDQAQSCGTDEEYIRSMTKEEMYQAIPTQNNFPSEAKRGIESLVTSHRVKIGGAKHLEQIGSIAGFVRNNNLLENSEVVLEMGAGRATTGFIVSGVVARSKYATARASNMEDLKKKVKLVLVERGSSRAKADAVFRRNLPTEGQDGQKKEDYCKVDDVEKHRIKCDLSHVNIPCALEDAGVSAFTSTKIDGTAEDHKRDTLVVAKHLCGAGTDLALKSIHSIRHRLNGCVLATCCHGVCDWSLYVGRDILINIMAEAAKEGDQPFCEESFNLMKRWACGTIIPIATANHSGISPETNTDPVKKDDDHFISAVDNKRDNLNVARVSEALNLGCGPQGLGRACQRLIDYGRMQYMRNELFKEGYCGDVDMCHYVDSSVTPQNALLFSRPARKIAN